MKIESKDIKMVGVDEIKPHPKNSNRHGDDQIQRLSKIIEYSGFRQPLVVSNQSGYLISGHGRLSAAQKLGMKKVPVIYEDFEDETMEYQHLTADNAIASWAGLDFKKINEDFLDFGPELDIDLLGIKDFEVEPADKAKEATEDEVPNVTTAISKLGDIYELNGHRLVCGDSTDSDTVAKLMNGEKADMVFTDPPYGMDAVSKDGKVGGDSKAAPAGQYRPVIGDENTDVARECFKLLTELQPKVMIYWGANYFTDFLPPTSGWIYWHKERPEGLTFSDGELAWTNLDKPLRCHKVRWDGYHKEGERGVKRVHPTQKPIILAERCFEDYKDIKSVLDLFGGSGSTLIACEKTKRTCYMMELDPHYVDVIVTRWCKYTGITDIKRNGEPMEWHIKADA